LVYVKNDRGINQDQKINKSGSPVKEDIQKVKPRNIQIVKNPHAQEASSWKDGKLVIKSESLESLARKLERYFNVRISFKNDSIRNFKYSGILEEVTIEEVLRALERTSPVRFEINKNQIILSLSDKN